MEAIFGHEFAPDARLFFSTPRHRAISVDSRPSGEALTAPCSASGKDLTALQGFVVVPLPGMLLTQDLFKAAGLDQAFSGYASAVDAKLGEDSILSTSSIHEAAESVVSGLESRHDGALGVLIGHSYGGYVALEVARRAPQCLAGLVLISTQSPGDTKGAAARRQQQVELARTEGISKLINGLLPHLLSPKAQQDDATVEMVIHMAERTGFGHLKQQMQACIERPDQRGTLRDLDPRIPVLVISGAKDKLIPPRCARELASELKARDATARERCTGIAPWMVRTHMESGHLLSMEQPEAMHYYLSSWADEVHLHNCKVAMEAAAGAAATSD